MNSLRFFSPISLGAGLIFWLGSFPAAVAQTPILQYNFNTASGNTAASTGSDTSAVTFHDGSGTVASLYSSAGGGVSGGAGDAAFDNTASNGMGGAGPSPSTNSGGTASGGVAATGTLTSLASLTSFTLTGWFKTEGAEPIGAGAQLISYGGSTGFFVNSGAGDLTLNIGNGSGTTSGAGSTGGAYKATTTWVFFAVTYDGTAADHNVSFYVGTTTDAVKLVNTATLKTGTTPNVHASLYIGNDEVGGTTQRPADALIDDIAIYGATSGPGGVLTLANLEAIRAKNAATAP